MVASSNHDYSFLVTEEKGPKDEQESIEQLHAASQIHDKKRREISMAYSFKN